MMDEQLLNYYDCFLIWISSGMMKKFFLLICIGVLSFGVTCSASAQAAKTTKTANTKSKTTTETKTQTQSSPTTSTKIKVDPSNLTNQAAFGVTSNPAAVTEYVGTAAAQHYIEKKLGITNEHGIRIGGAWLGDVNDLFAGGIPNAQQWTGNSLFLLDLSVDTSKISGMNTGMFDVDFLQFNGQDTNGQAGSIQGYNSLPGPLPLNRSELYELWYKNELLNKKLILRIGKVVPSYDFGNVIRPIPVSRDSLSIPTVTNLIFTPIFVNSSMLGVMPGYYNSSYGVTVNLLPTKRTYLSFGAYDGSQAQGIQTGIRPWPVFSGAGFYIGETGLDWVIGKNNLLGNFGIGGWRQTGLIQGSPTLSEHNASGAYLFGAQRVWYKNPGVSIDGVSVFYQFGINDSSALPMKKYVGGGLTGFGLIPKRRDDTIGMGATLSWLNPNSFNRSSELIIQAYYQAMVTSGIFLEPALSYIPTPGASNTLDPAWAGTLRAIILF